MLSLIELQNKKVEAKRKKYEKEEMDTYLEIVFDNYKQLTEENARLTEQLRKKDREMEEERADLNSKIKTLSDGVQYYRSIETTLQKALVLAEKTSKETKDAAILKAESIEKAAHLHADKIINNAEEEYQKIREKSMQLIQQFNQYKLQLKEAASAQLQLVDGAEFDIHNPEDLDVKEETENAQEQTHIDEKTSVQVKETAGDAATSVEETTAATEHNTKVVVSDHNMPAATNTKKDVEMNEEDRTAEILSADTIDLRDTLQALQEENLEEKEAAEEKTVAEEKKVVEEPAQSVTKAAVTTPIEATPVTPVDVTFTSAEKTASAEEKIEVEKKSKESQEMVVESKNEDLVPTLDSLLQDLNMNNKEKKTDDPFEFLGSVDF